MGQFQAQSHFQKMEAVALDQLKVMRRNATMVAVVGNDLYLEKDAQPKRRTTRGRGILDSDGREELVLTGMPSTFCCSVGDILNVN